MGDRRQQHTKIKTLSKKLENPAGAKNYPPTSRERARERAVEREREGFDPKSDDNLDLGG